MTGAQAVAELLVLGPILAVAQEAKLADLAGLHFGDAHSANGAFIRCRLAAAAIMSGCQESPMYGMTVYAKSRRPLAMVGQSVTACCGGSGSFRSCASARS